MPPTPTPHQLLAETLLGTALDSWITERRDRGHSWRMIAEELAQVTDNKVTLASETLRGWFIDMVASGWECTS